MKAIILEKPEHFTYADIDEPTQPGPVSYTHLTLPTKA